MDFELFIDRLASLGKQYFLPVLVGFAGLIFLGIGLISLFGQKADDSIVLEKGSVSTDAQKISETQQSLMVDVQGAVYKPGVYPMSNEDRVEQLLAKAGGLTTDANQSWVAKNLNLASKLKDGIKIYIPFEGEVLAAQESTNTININSASISDLDSLSGVGLATASKIIDNRPYATIEELLERKIVGKSVFEKIKDKISAL